MGPIAGPAQRGPGEVDTCEGAAKGHGEGPPRTLQQEINEIQAESMDPTADRHLPARLPASQQVARDVDRYLPWCCGLYAQLLGLVRSSLPVLLQAWSRHSTAHGPCIAGDPAGVQPTLFAPAETDSHKSLKP